MVNCTMCNKAFRSRVGKTSNTRCESCATMWRQKQMLQEENDRFKEAKEIELKIREFSLREKELELEKQKVTIKETSPGSGNVVELTCYYDQNSRDKIHDLLAGARRTLPKPPSESRLLQQRRRYLSTQTSTYSDDDDIRDDKFLLRRPRKLPSLEGVVNNERTKQRHRLEDECSTSANTSGLSVD